jgi:hypothetical protein
MIMITKKPFNISFAPTKDKIKIKENEIKQENFKHMAMYIPEILEVGIEKDKTIWVDTGCGWLWFTKRYSDTLKQRTNQRKKILKMLEFAKIRKQIKISQ